VLIFRYVISRTNRRGEVLLHEGKEGYLQGRLSITWSSGNLPKLWITKATYGHPTPKDGRGCFDVTERFTGLVDQAGGDFLRLGTKQDLSVLFGDPCIGIKKTLNIEYEIIGYMGQARQYELNGRLIKDVHIGLYPVVKPSIVIQNAYYGWSQRDIINKITDLQSKIKLQNNSTDEFDNLTKDMSNSDFVERAIDHDLTHDITLTYRDTFDITQEQKPDISSKMKSTAELELQFIQSLNNPCIDITKILQELVDNSSDNCLDIGLNSRLNDLFCDPCPGYTKNVHIKYSLYGFGTQIFFLIQLIHNQLTLFNR